MRCGVGAGVGGAFVFWGIWVGVGAGVVDGGSIELLFLESWSYRAEVCVTIQRGTNINARILRITIALLMGFLAVRVQTSL